MSVKVQLLSTPFEDCAHAHGMARIRLFRSILRADGRRQLELEQEEVVKNLITDVGLNWIVDQISAVPAVAAMSHMGLGTDGTPPKATNVALGAAIAGSRLAILSGPTQSSPGKLTYSTIWDLGVATSPTVAESGTFNAPAAGDMLARIAFGPFDKTAEHILSIERIWTFTRGE